MTENVNTVDTAGEAKKKKPLLTVVVVILVLLVILLAGGLGYMLLSGGSSPLAGLGGLGGGGIDQDTFIVNMDQLVLRSNDLDAKYNTAAGGDGRMDNAKFSHNFGATYAKPFILNTGRVDGWDISLERANPNEFAPEFVRSQVSYFETNDGASTALSEDWFWAFQLEDRNPDEVLDKNCNVGNDCISYMYKEAKAGSGAITERYDVAFRYQNTMGWVVIKGQQGEVSEELALEYAQMVLDKIELLAQ